MQRRQFGLGTLFSTLALMAASIKPVKAASVPGNSIVMWKPDDTYRSTEAELDPDLQFEGEANAFYHVTGLLVFGPLSSQAGFRWTLSATDRSNAVGRKLIRSINEWSDFEVNETDAQIDNGIDVGNYLYTFSGYLQMSATAGVIGIIWGAREPDGVTDAILYGRSYLVATRMN